MSLYQVLGISRDATASEVQRAYHGKARQHHPDATGSEDSSTFRTLHEAYEVLSDPDRRQAYDRSLGQEVPVTLHHAEARLGDQIQECQARRRRARVSDDIFEVRSRRFTAT